jgi:Etoposide-induced protein 2.4 (EI24)
MHLVLPSFLRGLLNLLHPKILLLTLVPFAIAGTLWGVLGWQYWDDWTAWLLAGLSGSGVGSTVRSLAQGALGDAVRLILAPLLAMLLLVPLVAATAMLLITVLGMPVLVNHVSSRGYTDLELKRGGTWAGSLANSLFVTVIWLLGWIVTLPLWFIPIVGGIIPLLLVGWASSRMFGYDALAEHASAEERQAILKGNRGALFTLGALLALFGTAPTLLWLSGAFVVILLPVTALFAVWLYGLVFVLSGLAFAHFALAALKQHRSSQVIPNQPARQAPLLTSTP